MTNQASQSFETMISVFSCRGTRSSVMLRDMDVPTSNMFTAHKHSLSKIEHFSFDVLCKAGFLELHRHA